MLIRHWALFACLSFELIHCSSEPGRSRVAVAGSGGNSLTEGAATVSTPGSGGSRAVGGATSASGGVATGGATSNMGVGGAGTSGGSTAMGTGSTSSGGASGTCTPNTKQCTGNSVQTCDANGVWGTAQACTGNTPICSGAGNCIAGSNGTTPPSCAGLPATCGGPSGTLDCCTSLTVPGGTYFRSDEVQSQSDPATISTFRLDKFEVTVGRFRKFVAAYTQNVIAAGAGKNPNNASDTGWDTAWNQSLPSDAAALKSALNCSGETGSGYATWTDSPGAMENFPINCVTWFDAQAFCTWDGGRLATEAEWVYAAVGGADQRKYPWVTTPAGTPTPTNEEPGMNANFAVYDCRYMGNGSCSSVMNIAPVGTVPAGDGKWGHSDLGGNLWDWTQDWFLPGGYPSPCNDCAGLTQDPAEFSRTKRGGSYSDGADRLLSAHRNEEDPTVRDPRDGIRCARAQ